MTDIVSTAGVLNASVKHALDATQKMDAFAKNSAKALKDGETLNFFQNAVKDIKVFGKASMVLELAAAGLTLIGEITGAKSTEDKILDGVTEIIGRVKTMEADMDSKFREIEKQMNIQTGQLELGLELVKLQGKIKYLDTIAKNRKAGKGTGTLTTDLLSTDPTMFVDIFTTIEDSVTGAGAGTNPNVLKLIYEDSFGDITTVLPMAEHLMHQAALCLVSHIALENILYKHGTPQQRANKPDLNQIGQLYEAGLKTIAAAMHTYCADCLSQTKQKENIKGYINKNRVLPMGLSTSDYQGTSERVALLLLGHYPYLNFSVLAYEPISGHEKHRAYGSHFILDQFKDAAGNLMNLLVYWAPRTNTNRQELITYKEAADQSIYRKHPRKDRTFDVQWRNKPIGERYLFIFDIGWKAAAQVSKGVFYGTWGHYRKDLRPFTKEYAAEKDPKKKVPGAVIWIGFSADYDDKPRSDFGLASYNAMYGILAPYTTVCFWPD